MKVLKHVLVAILSVALTFAAFVVWAITDDALRREEYPVVAISDLLAEAAAGYVDEIDVRGTRYEAHVANSKRMKIAYGPKTTAAELAPLVGHAKIDVR